MANKPDNQITISQKKLSKLFPKQGKRLAQMLEGTFTRIMHNFNKFQIFLQVGRATKILNSPSKFT